MGGHSQIALKLALIFGNGFLGLEWLHGTDG